MESKSKIHAVLHWAANCVAVGLGILASTTSAQQVVDPVVITGSNTCYTIVCYHVVISDNRMVGEREDRLAAKGDSAGSKPSGLPSGTKGIDQVCSSAATHAIKSGQGMGAMAKVWFGVAPNGDVYYNGGTGRAVSAGHYTLYTSASGCKP